MTPGEVETVRETIAALTDRAMAAEARATRAEIERDQLRALLGRLRTSLAEATTLQVMT